MLTKTFLRLSSLAQVTAIASVAALAMVYGPELGATILVATLERKMMSPRGAWSRCGRAAWVR